MSLRRFYSLPELANRYAKCVAICLALTAFPQGAQASAGQLVGLGLHQETGRDIYLGALYLPEDTKRPANIASLAGPRTMEYRVVARRTSIRSLLGSMLLQSEIATGKPPSASTTEFADALLSRIKSSLYSGDSLQIALTPDDQTVASLNGHQMARVNDPEVANYLLIGWLDKRGPSTAFRNSLLATSIASDLRNRLEASQPSEQRSAEVARWSSRAGGELPVTQPLAVNAEAEALVEVQNAEATPVSTAPVEQTYPAQLPEPSQSPSQQSMQQLAQTDAAAPPAGLGAAANVPGETTALSAEAAASYAGQDLSRPEQIGQLDSTIETQPGAPLPELDLGDGLAQTTEAPSLDTLGDLRNSTSLALNSQDLGSIKLDTEILSLGVREYSRRLSAFHNNLVTRVYRAIKYPKRAIRRSLEGRLELDVTLRKTGELVAVSVAETSGHSLLDEAAVAAAESAFEEPGASPVDVVAIAEFGTQDGRVVVPVPVSFQLMK